MKKLFALAAFTCLSVSAFSQANLLENGDFEGAYIENLPEGWLQKGVDGGTNTNNGAGPTTQITLAPKSGDKYHRFTNLNANQWANIQQIVKLEGGKHYKLSFWNIYQGNAFPVDYDVLYIACNSEQAAKDARPGGMTLLNKRTNSDGVVESDWVENTLYFSVESGAEWVRIGFRKSGGQWYTDDVRLEEVASIPSGMETLKYNNKIKCVSYNVEDQFFIFAGDNQKVSIYTLSGTLIKDQILVSGSNSIDMQNVVAGLYYGIITDQSNEKGRIRIVKK